MPYADPERRHQRNLKYKAARRDRLRAEAKQYYARNRERILKSQKESRKTNPAYQREYQRQYQIANRERLAQYKKDWWTANPQRHGRYYAENRELIKWRRKAHYAAHIEDERRKLRKRYAANPEPFKANSRIRRVRLAGVQAVPFTNDQWLAKVFYWGNQCWICGGEWKARDHVKPITAGGGDMLCNMRPICQPCNSRKKNAWPLADLLGVHRRGHHQS